MPESHSQNPDKGQRYPQEVWDSLRYEWESDPTLSYQGALNIVKHRFPDIALPSKGAVLTYAKRNGWAKKEGAQPIPRPPQPKPEKKPRPPVVTEAVVAGETIPLDFEGLDLTPREQIFVSEYLVDFNGAAAVRRAGYETKSPWGYAWHVLSKPEIAEAISRALRRREQRIEIKHEMVLAHWYELWKADPRELVEYRVHCCRYCHGVEHQYQWTEQEFKRACDRVREWNENAEMKGLKTRKPMPVAFGGFGYDMNKPPHPECPECGGYGFGKVYIKDTRYLSPGARLLYAGIEETKDGIKVKMHDQAKALENIARYIGMFKEKIEVDVTVQNVDQLESLYHQKVAEMREKRQQFEGRGERLRHLAQDAEDIEVR